jgi:CRISPR/Cas system-associated exonuclease Cas4 (RecB family)
MGRILQNDFSWSKSRHEKLSECSRAYYLYYYRSWRGWESGAPKEVREAYVLKKLHNRYTWAGSVVHDVIKQSLNALRAGRQVDPARSIERAHQLMQQDWRHSAAKAYWREKARKDFSGLVEHEYEEPIAPEEWKQNWEVVRQALEWFHGSRWLSLAQQLERPQWLEVDEGLDKAVFQLEGVKVFAIPDFAYREADGRPIVVDWKTGRSREGYDDQVLGYALYLSERYGFPLKDIRAVLVYLNEGREQEVQVDPEAVDGFRQRFRASVDRMRQLLADPAGNVPHPEAFFPMAEDLARCGRCTFRRLCGREAARAQVA